jgi:soluble lytic murein transglycosylase-like protein
MPAGSRQMRLLPSSAELASARELARFANAEHAFHAIQSSAVPDAEHPPPQFALIPPNAHETRQRLLRRLPHGGAIAEAADRNEIDALLLAAVVEAESGFDASVVSVRGATGLMQIMPALAGVNAGELLDPVVNLNLGARHMSSLVRRFDGDLELALAAYNAGPGAVRRFGGVPPYKETTRFVRKVLSLYAAHRLSVQAASPDAVASVVPPGSIRTAR